MIRLANKFDIAACTEMIRKYAEESPVEILKDTKHHNDKYIREMLESLIIGRGFVLVDDQMRGMLAAIIAPNFWCPTVSEVKEVAWWVHPDHRQGTIGGRLFFEFVKHSEMLVKQKRAEIVCASLMHTSQVHELPGFKKIEMTFVKE
jgi:hypothetical protein